MKNRVRSLREFMGLTQANLAEIVGVSRQTIIGIERGQINPSILLCLRIAEALDCGVHELFYLSAVMRGLVLPGTGAPSDPRASTLRGSTPLS